MTPWQAVPVIGGGLAGLGAFAAAVQYLLISPRRIQERQEDLQSRLGKVEEAQVTAVSRLDRIADATERTAEAIGGLRGELVEMRRNSTEQFQQVAKEIGQLQGARGFGEYRK